MSTQTLKKTDKDWQEKYYQLLDEIDRQKESFDTREKKLLNSIIKLSISHQGNDNALDKEINAFRNAVRKVSAPDKQETLIDNIIEKIITIGEQDKVETSSNEEDSLLTFLEQLDVTPEDKHGINGLKRKLIENQNSSYNEQIIRQTSDYINQLIKTTSNDHSANDSEHNELSNFISKLKLPINSANDITQLNHQLNSIFEAQERLTHIEKIIALFNQSLHNSEKPTANDTEIDAYELFIQLLEWLSIPQSFKQEFAQLKTDFSRECFEHTPTEALKNISEFIGQLHRNLQNELTEMENYLAKVIKRLKEFEDHLIGSQSQEEENLVLAQNFNSQMKQRAEQLKQDIDSCGNIDEIKITLDSHLEIIDANLDIRFKSEQERQIESQKAIESLSKRVVQTESESKKLQNMIALEREKALKDALTGIANRMAYESKITDEYSRWQRYQQPLSLSIIDIDDFKLINDQYGHSAGDKVLKAVAKICQQKSREIDFLARFGGEEFVLVLPNTDQKRAFAAVENLRQAISNFAFLHNKKKVPITISIGIAEFAKGDKIDTVFDRADNALYEAKRSGKNRSVIAKANHT